MRLLPSLSRQLELDRPGLGFALQLVVSAWLSFAIAAHFHLHNAYWAAMPAWVVAQSTRGLLVERALFRIVGTFLGVGVGFLLLKATGNVYLQLFGFGCWIAVCAALTHLLRAVHAYGALMSAITAAVIFLPSVLDPEHTMERAMARVQCTFIGVAVVTVVTGFFTPRSGRKAFYLRVRRLAGDTVAFAAAALRGEAGDEEERKILAELNEVDTAAALVSSGSIEGYRRLHHVHALTVTSLEVMAAGCALRDQRASGGEPPDEGLGEKLAVLAGYLRGEVPNAGAWQELVTSGKVPPRLDEALRKLRAADRVLFNEPGEADARSFGRKAVYLAPHYDWALARSTGLVCGAAAFLAPIIGLAVDGRIGLMVAMGVTIFSVLLSSVPMPQKLAPKVLLGVVVGVAAAMSYRLFLQPQVDSMKLLLLSVLPFMALGSLVRASGRFAVAGLEGMMCFMFASQAGMPATTATEIFKEGGALILAALVVAGGFLLLPRRPLRHAQDAVAVIRRDLMRMIRAPSGDWQPDTGRQILRLMTHLGRAGGMEQDLPGSLLPALNLGNSVAELRKATQDPAAAEQATRALELLGNFTTDPLAVSDALEREAVGTGNESLAITLRTAAVALRSGKELFRFGLE